MNLAPIYFFTTAKNKEVGPVSRVDLETAMRSPDWYAEALIWQEGWVNWLSWRDAAAQIGIVIPGSADVSFANGAGRPSSSGNFYSPPSARLHQDNRSVIEAVEMVYAPFLKRFAAWFIDQIVLYVAVFAFVAILGIAAAFLVPAEGDSGDSSLIFVFGYILGVIAIYLAYYVVFDTSVSGATLGKKALGIRVTDADGQRIGVGRSIVRTLSCGLSYITLYIGFLMAAMTARSQALHDLIAKTVVIEKNPTGARSSTGSAVAIGIALCAAAAMVLIPIVAAIALPAYSDYTRRAAVEFAIQETEPLRDSIHAYRIANAECPSNDTEGFGSAESYAGKHHSSVWIGLDTRSSEDVTCQIRIIMGGREMQAPDGSLVLLMSSDGRIRCEAETLLNRHLPSSCRGD